VFFLRRGVVSTSPNSQDGGPPLVGCPRLLIQFIHTCLTYRRPFLHPQPEDAPCRGDRDLQRRWEDNIKMDLQEVGGPRGDWMELAQELVGTVRDFRVP
jgi:hypothetical protein